MGHHLFAAPTFERGVAGERAKEGCPKRIHVGRRGRRLALQNLGGGERRRTGDYTGRGLKPPGDPGDAEIIELRLRVVRGDKPVTETWLYRWTAA